MNPLTGRDDKPAPRRPGSQPMDANDRVRTRITAMGMFEPPRRKPIEMDDDLRELMREAGIDADGPDGPKLDQSATRGEAKRNAERRRITIPDMSRSEFLRIYDGIFDAYQQTVAERNDDDLKARKRLTKLHLFLQYLQKNNLIKQDGNSVSIDVSEEDLKRLYKGLETLIQKGLMNDEEKLKPFFDAIKKFYRGSFSSLPEIKNTLEVVEFKGLGRAVARRAVAGIRRIADRVDYDGDDDGFITNPLTGRDEIPWARGRETQEQAIERFFGGRRPSSIAEMVRPISRQPMQQATPVTQSKLFEGPTDKYRRHVTHSTAKITESLARLRRSITTSKIKDRDWGASSEAVKSIIGQAESKYGKLESMADFEAAFSAAGLNATFINWKRRITPVERGFLIGVLHAMEAGGGKYENMDIVIHRDRVDPMTGEIMPTPAAGAAPFFKYDDQRSTSNSIKLLRRGNKQVLEVMFTDALADQTGMFIESTLIDTTSTQLLKAFLNSEDIQNLSEEQVYDSVGQLHGVLTGLHEASHTLHHVASRLDVWSSDMTDAEIEKEVTDFLNSNPVGTLQQFFRRTTVEQLDIMAFAERESHPLKIQLAIEMLSQSTDPQEKAQISEFLHKVRLGLELREAANLPDAGLSAEDLKKLDDIISAGSADPREFGRVAMEDPEFLDRLAVGMRKAAGLPNSDSIEDMATSFMSQNPKMAQLWALLMWEQGKTWDGLTQEQIAAARQAWKYISSYAKDKNSYYDGYFAGFTSMEGIAELMTAIFAGIQLPEDKIGKEALEAFAILRSWLTGPSPTGGAKSVDSVLIATKTIYDLLSLRGPHE